MIQPASSAPTSTTVRATAIPVNAPANETTTTDGYAGTVQTPLQAREIYGDNPALAAAKATKDGTTVVGIAAGVFLGLVVFACCCATVPPYGLNPWNYPPSPHDPG